MLDKPSQRRRLILRLVGGAGLGSIPFFAAVAAAPIIVYEISGSETLSGVAVASLSVGTGLGATFFAQLMSRRGRRPGLVTAYLVAALGAACGVAGAATGKVVPLLAGLVLMGGGHSANNLARYAAGELAVAERRASAVGLVVWAATIGAIVGPNLLSPTGVLASAVGLEPLAGPFVVGMALFAGVALLYQLTLRPEPSTLATEDLEDLRGPAGANRQVRLLLNSARVRVAIFAMALSQFVMVLVMSVTPLHMTSLGHSRGSVGFVLSAHFAGMYALSPVSGWVADRFGTITAVWAGFGVLLLSVVTVVVTESAGGPILSGPLFLVGFGWSLSFVGGSALLSEGLAYRERTRLQGAADTVIWSCSALAGVTSGFMLGLFGYRSLSLAAGSAVILAAGALKVARRNATGI